MIKHFKSNLLFLCALTVSIFPSVQAIELNKLNLLLEPCLSPSRSEECMRSLMKLEDYQIKAASRENYACQTRLIGLQTDLILIMNKQKGKKAYLRMIKEVKHFC
tara:strand:- start:699 stop:1013 length:315 start_codon:yes stop_codon:yes gene_type:complete